MQSTKGYLTPERSSKFLQQELAGRKELVQEARTDGASYTGYPDGFPILRKEDVQFLKTDFDAAQYQYENTTDRDSVSVVSLDQFETIIDRQIDLQQQIDQHFPGARGRELSSDQGMEM